MSKIKLVIFDWDGTLMDSEAKIVHCFQSAMRDLDLPIRDTKLISQQIGLGLPEVALQLYPDADAAAHEIFLDRYRYHFFSSEIMPPLYKDVPELLALLQNQGFLLAVATGKSRRGLEKSLDESGLRSFFTATRNAEETRSKPDPLMLLELLEFFNLPAEQSIMIGDTSFDINMGNAAGMATIALEYGTHSRAQLLACQPTECWSSLQPLPKFLGINHE